jgi:hypothetical protein
MDVNVDVRLPRQGKALLARLQSKQITMEQFEQETAYWMMDSLNGCRWVCYPLVPTDLMEYYRRRKQDKRFSMGEEFWHQPHIRQYMDANSRIKAVNFANRYWLDYMQHHIPQEDMESHKKISEVKRTFPKLAI